MASCYCYCCGCDISEGERKKRRRPLSSKELKSGELQTLVTFVSELQEAIDVSRLCAGHVCRSCAVLLKRYNDVQCQLRDNIKAALPILPAADLEDHPRPAEHIVPAATMRTSATQHDTVIVPAASNESPPVVVSFKL